MYNYYLGKLWSSTTSYVSKPWIETPSQCSHLLNFTINKVKQKKFENRERKQRRFDDDYNQRSVYITNKLAVLTLNRTNRIYK